MVCFASVLYRIIWSVRDSSFFKLVHQTQFLLQNFKTSFLSQEFNGNWESNQILGYELIQNQGYELLNPRGYEFPNTKGHESFHLATYELPNSRVYESSNPKGYELFNLAISEIPNLFSEVMSFDSIKHSITKLSIAREISSYKLFNSFRLHQIHSNWLSRIQKLYFVIMICKSDLIIQLQGSVNILLITEIS